MNNLNQVVIEEPCFLGDEFGPTEPPEKIMLHSARETFGIRDDESLEDALARFGQRSAVDEKTR